MAKPVFPCMLAHKFEPKHVRFPCYVEPKLDGIRALIVVDPIRRTVQTFSRLGNTFSSVKRIENELLLTLLRYGYRAPVCFDGELTCGSFKETVSAIKRQDEQASDAIFTAFDMLSPWSDPRELPLASGNHADYLAAGFGPLRLRRNRLQDFFDCYLTAYGRAGCAVRIAVQYQALTQADVDAHYAEFRAAGLEGAIVKDPEAFWIPKRSRAYLKIKERDTLDLRVIGAGEGEGRLSGTLGQLICGLPDNGNAFVRVGSGMPDAERAELWAMHQRGELVGRTVEVSFHERTPDGSLRHPVYEGLRVDK